MIHTYAGSTRSETRAAGQSVSSWYCSDGAQSGNGLNTPPPNQTGVGSSHTDVGMLSCGIGYSNKIYNQNEIAKELTISIIVKYN